MTVRCVMLSCSERLLTGRNCVMAARLDGNHAPKADGNAPDRQQQHEFAE